MIYLFMIMLFQDIYKNNKIFVAQFFIIDV